MKRREFIGKAGVLGVSLPILTLPEEKKANPPKTLPLTKANLEEVKKQANIRPGLEATDEEWATYLIKQWERTGLLQGLSEEQKPTVVLAMENQRIWNENTANTNISQFKRISIPIIRRLVPKLMEHFSICSSIHAKAPQMTYVPRNWTRDNSSRKPFKGLWNKTSPELFLQSQAWGRGQMHNLDVEADETALLAEYVMEDVGEIIRLRNMQRSKKETLCFYCFGLISVAGGLSFNGHVDAGVRPQMVLFYEWV